MKITVAFLLVALSCCYQDGSALLDLLNTGTDTSALTDCLKKALVPDKTDLINGLGKVLTSQCPNKDISTSDAREQTCKATAAFVRDAGCAVAVEKLLGGKTLDEISGQLGDACDPLVKTVTDIVGKILSPETGEILSGTYCALSLDDVTEKLTSILDGLLGKLGI